MSTQFSDTRDVRDSLAAVDVSILHIHTQDARKGLGLAMDDQLVAGARSAAKERQSDRQAGRTWAWMKDENVGCRTQTGVAGLSFCSSSHCRPTQLISSGGRWLLFPLPHDALFSASDMSWSMGQVLPYDHSRRSLVLSLFRHERVGALSGIARDRDDDDDDGQRGKGAGKGID